MSDENKNPNKIPLPEGALEGVDSREQKSLREVWTLAGVAEPNHFVSPDETGDALEELHIRLGMEGKRALPTNKILGIGRWLAAAVALIVIGWAFFGISQSVTAPNGQQAEVNLADGSVVELNSGAGIRFNRLFGYTNRDITLSGEAYFHVASSSEPFRVYANGTVTEVTGTRFSIRSWPDDPEGKTNITVLEGEVRFYPESDPLKAVKLNKERTSIWQPGLDKPKDPEPANIETMTGWRDQKFIFYEQSLSEIFDEIERRFNVKIELQSSGVAGETLTGYYGEVGDSESLLEDICTVAGLNYAKTANGYRVY